MSDERNERCALLLLSEEAKPFWEMLDAIGAVYEKDLRRTRDGNLTYALDALDRVRDIQRRLGPARKKTVDALGKRR